MNYKERDDKRDQKGSRAFTPRAFTPRALSSDRNTSYRSFRKTSDSFRTNSFRKNSNSNFRKSSEPRRVKLIHADAYLPERLSYNNVGSSLTLLENLRIEPNAFVKVNFGMILDIKPKEYIEFFSTKDLAQKGILVTAPLFDSSYSGELHVYLKNLTDKLVELKKGQQPVELIYKSTQSNFKREDIEYVAVDDINYIKPATFKRH